MQLSAAAYIVAALALVGSSSESAGAQGTGARAPALSPFAREKARTLVRDKLSCLGCHRIGSQGGIIGPDLSRATAARSTERVLAMMRTPRAIAPDGTMPPVQLSDAVSRLVASYIATLDEIPVAPAISAAPPARATASGEGAVLYAWLCASCHGAGGDGKGPNAQYLPVPAAVHASREAMSKRTDDRLYDAIAAGGAVLGRSPRMPAFGAALTDAQMRALVRHIRELCACEGPAWSRDGTAGAPR